MIFDTTSLTKYFLDAIETHQLEVFRAVTENNPNWIEELKNDKTLMRDDLTKEEIEEQVNKVISNPNFVKYEMDWEKVKAIFHFINEDFLEKFKIEMK